MVREWVRFREGLGFFAECSEKKFRESSRNVRVLHEKFREGSGEVWGRFRGDSGKFQERFKKG